MKIRGWEYEYLDSVDSTNREAKRRAAAGGNRDILLRAGTQTNGRGRLDRRWESPLGAGIWMTQLFSPKNIAAENAGGAVFLSAVALCRTLRKMTHADVLIKWPNDLVLSGKKICGMLAECGFEGASCAWIALGTGLNLTKKALPEELVYASGIEDETGIKLDPDELIDAYLAEFDPLRETWEKEGLIPVIRQMEPLSATIGRDVRVNGEYARATAIAPGGGLVIRTPDGIERTVLAGDVSVRGITDYI